MSAGVARRAGIATLAVALTITGTASAKAGDRSFEQTYPVASKLCAKVAAGHTPKGLKSQAAQVTAACTKLQTAFGPLQAAVQAAQTTLANGVAADRAKIQQACQPASNRQTCRQTRIQARADIKTLRAAHRQAVRTYYIQIEGNRRSFWATIHSLRGGKNVTGDAPIPVQSS